VGLPSSYPCAPSLQIRPKMGRGSLSGSPKGARGSSLAWHRASQRECAIRDHPLAKISAADGGVALNVVVLNRILEARPTRQPGPFETGPTPGRRTDAYHTAEDPGEVRLVRESTIDGDRGERFGRSMFVSNSSSALLSCHDARDREILGASASGKSGLSSKPMSSAFSQRAQAAIVAACGDHETFVSSLC